MTPANKKNVFERAFKSMCKLNGISGRKPRFEKIEGVIVISVKNQLKEGVDIDCFRILNLIYQVVGPRGIKFNQQLITYPNSNRVDKVTVIFDKDEYENLNNIFLSQGQ